jgi:hypothetical protein
MAIPAVLFGTVDTASSGRMRLGCEVLVLGPLESSEMHSDQIPQRSRRVGWGMVDRKGSLSASLDTGNLETGHRQKTGLTAAAAEGMPAGGTAAGPLTLLTLDAIAT